MAQKVEYRLHVKGPESTYDFGLPLGNAVLGRDPGCELVLAYPLVSRRHAQLPVQTDAKFWTWKHGTGEWRQRTAGASQLERM
jgi:hypothetical protein